MKREQTKASAIAYLVILGVMGIVFLGISFSNYTKTNKPITDIYSVTAADVKPGMRLKGQAGFVLDSFADYGNEEETDKMYYVIVAGEDSAFYMGLEEYSSNFSALDFEIERSWDESITYENPTEGSKYVIDGIVAEMDGELLQYYEEFFTENEIYTPEELNSEYGYSLTHYYLRPVSNNLTGMYFCLVIGIIFLLAGLVMYIIIMNRVKNNESDMQYLTNLSSRNVASKSLRDSTAVSTTIQDSEKPPMGFE